MSTSKKKSATDPHIQMLIEKAKMLSRQISGDRRLPPVPSTVAEPPKPRPSTVLRSAKAKLRKAELSMAAGDWLNALGTVLGSWTHLPEWRHKAHEVNTVSRIMVVNFLLLEGWARYGWYLAERESKQLRGARRLFGRATESISEIRNSGDLRYADPERLADLCERYIGNQDPHEILAGYESRISAIIASMPPQRVRKALAV